MTLPTEKRRHLSVPLKVPSGGRGAHCSPRRIHLVVESKNVDWSIVVEEPDE